MKTILKIFLLLTGIIFVTACEKEIDLNMPEFEEKIVVEGAIENDALAWTFLSKNQGYLDEINFRDMGNITNPNDLFTYLSKYMVLPNIIYVDGETIDLRTLGVASSDVLITVSERGGTVIDTLDFYIDSMVLSGQGFVYPPAKFIGKKLKGEIGKQYDINIYKDGEKYDASTSITQPFVEDSVWFELENNSNTYGVIKTIINDDPKEKNYYRVYVRRLGKDDYFLNVDYLTQDDQFFNGQKFPMSISRPSQNDDDSVDPDSRGFFALGDSVMLKVCTMDHDHYWFWKTAMASGNNFFGQPGAIQSNIHGEALGVFGGYGVRYVLVVCK